jgi:phosphoglycerate dehydrogenase-like enzyme
VAENRHSDPTLIPVSPFAFVFSPQGYDPGLNVKSALTLPRDIVLADSIASAVANADYISINIPYVKGSPENGGTHGIIGSDVIAHFKQDAVLLNFARGELVDSEAMKEFLDSGHGVYVSDFPDDLLWNHDKAIILPHLGASTEEAEDEAAAMAADTIREYMEHGQHVHARATRAHHSNQCCEQKRSRNVVQDYRLLCQGGCQYCAANQSVAWRYRLQRY